MILQGDCLTALKELKSDIYRDVNITKIPTFNEYPDDPPFFNSSLKLLSDAKQLVICHMGFRFDSYMGNCSHNCSYCYARGQNMRYKRWPLEDIKIADLGYVKNMFEKVYSGNIGKKKEELCIQHKYPIRMGTQTDCFQEAEKKYRISYQFIKDIMNKYDYPYIACTKNKLVADDMYMELYGTNSAFQFTLSTLNQDTLDQIERGASTAADRLEAMNKLSKAGYRVSCRMSPYIPEFMKDPEELIIALSDNGCNHLISELLRVTPILNKVIKEECGYDVIASYKSMGVKCLSTYYRYPLLKKIEFQKYIAELCSKYGMTFATCADEDPSFHTTNNCCGVECLKEFDGCPMVTYDTLFNICKDNGSASFEDWIEYKWGPDIESLRDKWESGYIEQVLMNLQYDKNTNRYIYVDCNTTLKKANSLDRPEFLNF